MRLPTLSTATTIFALVALAPAARAAEPSDADRATARALAEQASDALEHKDFARAAELFGRADALVHAPTLALGFARAQAGLGKLVAAHETYTRIVRGAQEASANKTYALAVKDAERELAQLVPRLPTVEIVVTGPEAPAVEVDGVAVPAASLGVKRFVDPGAHTVRAVAPGWIAAERRFELLEKGGTRVEILLERDPSYPPIGGATSETPAREAQAGKPAPRPEPARRGGGPMFVAGLTLVGLGGGSLVASAVTGGLFLGEKATLDERCAAGVCDQEGLDAASRAETLALANTVTLAGGVGLAGVGLLLTLLDVPKEAEGPPGAVAFVTRGSLLGLEVRLP